MASVHSLVFIAENGDRTIFTGVYQVREKHNPNGTCAVSFKRDVEFDVCDIELTIKEGEKAFLNQPAIGSQDRNTNVAAFYPTKRER